ncbi:MAG: G5 domain-containing protein [Chloroflexi bacterium]|nr:G5 domain-containing protein [Chloroflexota bacterium]
MRLYHPSLHPLILACLALLALLAACAPPQLTQAVIQVSIVADGQIMPVEIPAGSSVQEALQTAALSLGPLDRVEPEIYTLLTNGAAVRVVRVTEEFSVVQEAISFEQQVLQTDSLPVNQKRLLQEGSNGLKEITYRQVFEDGAEISQQPVKAVIVREPIPEIIMVGIQRPYAPLEIPGRLVYLLSGSAWMMEQNTANRRPLVASGDLDGRILSLSDDGAWLLFTRRSDKEDEINTLWVAHLASEPVKEIPLGVSDIIHFADWVPGSTAKVIFSTAEFQRGVPGWRANNDLYVLSFSATGWVSNWKSKPVLEANVGGVYGWWGSAFAWSPQADRLAYSRPDGIGLVNYADGAQTSLLQNAPLLTQGDWAWSPGFSWSPDGGALYTVVHNPPQESQSFDMVAVPAAGGPAIPLARETGMFAYPVASPEGALATGEIGYQVAFLQAAFSNQSQTSPYRLWVLDRDGSNRRELFPQPGQPGLEPQQVVWSPQPLTDGSGYNIALLYAGNLWLVSPSTGEARQVTGDQQTNRITWK